jgi:hypothetical protein
VSKAGLHQHADRLRPVARARRRSSPGLPRRLVAAATAATAVFALLALSSAASAGVSDSADYEYKVVGFDYKASAQLSGGHFLPSCTAVEDSLWEGKVTTTDAAELAPLNLGDASLEVHPHGSSGQISAETQVGSKFSAKHTETTQCDETGSVVSTSTHSCTEDDETGLTAQVEIKGGIGDRVKLTWNFFIDDGQSLVPTTFTCVKPFQFAPGYSKDCSKGTSLLSLEKFTAKMVKIPFFCLYKTSRRPPGTNYTKFGSTANARGTLTLKRTRLR